jgi:hypothetical protein
MECGGLPPLFLNPQPSHTAGLRFGQSSLPDLVQPLSLLESTFMKALSLTIFRINTYKCVSKQRTLSTFRMNTYEKRREGDALIVN